MESGSEDRLELALASQYGAAFDMLEATLEACPDDALGAPGEDPSLWYITYHTLFWTRFYLLDVAAADLQPTPLFGLEEFDPRGVLPDPAKGREDLLACLAECRAALRAGLRGIAGHLDRPAPGRPGLGRFELLLYNLRHLQHGVGQVNLLLRQAGGTPGGWVSRGKSLRNGGGADGSA